MHRLPSLDAQAEFVRRTHEWLDAYAAAGHIPPIPDDYYDGDAALINFASDMLIDIGIVRWDDCSAEALHRMIGRLALEGMPQVLLAFRRWLAETGRTSDRGIADLARYVEALARGPIGLNRAERRRQEHMRRG